MKIEMSPAKRVLCLITIMLTNIAVMADLVIIPIISNLYQTFPDHVGYVNYIISGPMLIVVGSSLLATVLMKKLSKKVVIVTGGLIFSGGAVFGAAVSDPAFMAAMRTLVGVGQGLVNVVAVSLIADLYDDENVRARITGYYNASMSFVAILFSYLSGVIAQSSGWQSSFLCYWAAIPMLIMMFLFIPSIKQTDQTPAAAAASPKAAREPFGWRYWSMASSWFLLNVMFGATVLYYISPYIVENNLGDSAFTGLATSIKSIVGFIICLGFGAIYAGLKRQTNTICFLIAAASIFLMILFPSKFAAVVLATIAGCAYKVSFSYVYARGFQIVPASRRDDAVAVTTAIYGIGSFLSTYFASWLMGVMHVDRVTNMFIVPVVIFVLLAVFEVITAAKEKRELVAVPA